MTVSLRNFDKQMQYLSKHYKVLPLTELLNLIKSGKDLNDHYCAITFDDGWRDNYTNAYPILRKYGLPATIFLTTNFLNGQQWFWEERVKYLLTHVYCAFKTSVPPETEYDVLRSFLTKYGVHELLSLNSDKLPPYLTKIVKKLRAETPSDIDQFCRELETITQHRYFSEPRRFLDWDEVREMLQNNIEFGAHSKSHINFELCTADDAFSEINHSKQVVEQQTGRSISIFAYPYGKNNTDIVSMVKNAGFDYAFTTIPGLVSHDDDLLRIPRIDIHNDQSPTRAFFACRILKFLNVF
jgi:peptidoglycan/xylan/chitin deacetylase (PgdA/CDA1 family)